MKVSASAPKKFPIKVKDHSPTEQLLRSVVDEQKSMLEELDQTLLIMREVLASLKAAQSSVVRFGGRPCPPSKM